MPTYQYSCTDCGHFFETFQSFSDDSLTVCPECGGKLRKVFNAVGVVFKGSGFYRNDSRAGAGKGGSNGSNGSNGSESGSGSGSSEKSAPAASTENGSSKGSGESKPAASSPSSSAGGSGSAAAKPA